LWYSTCHCVCNPNVNNTAQSDTVFPWFTLYCIQHRRFVQIKYKKI